LILILQMNMEDLSFKAEMLEGEITMDNNKERRRQDDLTNEEVIARMNRVKETLNVTTFDADGTVKMSKMNHRNAMFNRTNGVDDTLFSDISGTPSLETSVSQFLNTPFNSSSITNNDDTVFIGSPSHLPIKVFKSKEWYFAVEEKDLELTPDRDNLSNDEMSKYHTKLRKRGVIFIYTNDNKQYMLFNTVSIFKLDDSGKPTMFVPINDFNNLSQDNSYNHIYKMPIIIEADDVTDEFLLLSRLTEDK
jgi:hypothetical protein